MGDPYTMIKKKYFGSAWKPQAASHDNTVLIKYLLAE